MLHAICIEIRICACSSLYDCMSTCSSSRLVYRYQLQSRLDLSLVRSSEAHTFRFESNIFVVAHTCIAAMTSSDRQLIPDQNMTLQFVEFTVSACLSSL